MSTFLIDILECLLKYSTIIGNNISSENQLSYWFFLMLYMFSLPQSSVHIMSVNYSHGIVLIFWCYFGFLSKLTSIISSNVVDHQIKYKSFVIHHKIPFHNFPLKTTTLTIKYWINQQLKWIIIIIEYVHTLVHYRSQIC